MNEEKNSLEKPEGNTQRESKGVLFTIFFHSFSLSSFSLPFDVFILLIDFEKKE